MTEQERNDTEEIAHVLCNEDISCSECQDILQNRCIELDKAETLRDIGYRKISEGDIIIHKYPTERTEEEIEWLVNHNKAVREEAAEKIFWYLNDEWDHNPLHFVDFLKEEFGVNIKDEQQTN